MREFRHKAIIKSILGANIEIEKVFILNNFGSGNILVFQLKGKKVKYLLKSYNEQKYIDRETKNLKNINDITIFNKPKYFGKYKNFYIQEYIKGDLFQNLIKKSPNKNLEKYYLSAVENLTIIHTSSNYVKDKRKLNRVFFPAGLKKRLDIAFNLIQSFGFIFYKEAVGEINEKWIKAIKKIKIEKLINDLKIEKSDYFLGHGDYKPNNIIFTKDKKIFIIDWLGMSKAQPWYDLAYLLALLDLNKRFQFFEIYFNIMREKGYLLKMSKVKAKRLFKSGIIFQEIIRAKSNAHLIKKGKTQKELCHIKEFKNALDGLLNILEYKI
ncbi:phosphotransferase [Candidatus Parcubacteria bacterium]|nr:phosphotransferase [Candidatus Parcubacteria bacterium]